MNIETAARIVREAFTKNPNLTENEIRDILIIFCVGRDTYQSTQDTMQRTIGFLANQVGRMRNELNKNL